MGAVRADRKPPWSRDGIAANYRSTLGVRHVIWRERGPKEEEWGRLEDGRWGIGTGGHIDVFCRFADPTTILLAEVSEEQARASPILRETALRMEENFRILTQARDQDGKPFRIIRMPVPDLMVARADVDSLSTGERTWVEGARPGTVAEFYLPGSYINFVIANAVVVTTRYGREGSPAPVRARDEQAKHALEQGFPGRRIVQIDASPLHYDGAGLHCYTRHQPQIR